jgi:folate-binding protein YgfZ
VNALRFVPEQSRLILTGEDRRDFLHRMTTNDVQALAPGQGCVTLLLERTGRLVDRLVLLERGDDCLLLGTVARETAVVEWIERYVIADDVSVRDVTAETAGVLIAGHDAAAALAAAGLPVPAAGGDHREADLGGTPVTVARDPGPGVARFHLIGARPLASLASLASLSEGTARDWAGIRVEAGLPVYGAEWDERTIPLEAGLAPAISFTKGCYVGQEVVARLHNYRRVKRVLARLEIAGGDEPAPGAPLSADGKDVGRVTSVARVGERLLALARVEAAHGEAGARLALEDGTAATVTPLATEEDS